MYQAKKAPESGRKIAYSFDAAAEATGMSKSFLRKAADDPDPERRLRTVRVNRRRLIRADDLGDWFSSVPCRLKVLSEAPTWRLVMRNARIAILATICLLMFPAVSLAQEIYSINGGNRVESDPKNKKRVLLIAENSDLRLTVGVPKQNKPVLGLVEIWAKVENLSDKPLMIDPTKYHAVDDEGRAYAGLPPKDAIQRAFERMGTDTGSLFVGALAGPLTPQRAVTEWVNREALAPGEIPPHSFKDGGLYFEAPKQKKFTLQITLTELWPTAFTFSTDKPKP